MLTDIRPIVERILRQLVLAGLPIVAVACDGGRGSGGSTTGTGGAAPNTGGIGIGVGSGGMGGLGVSTGGMGGGSGGAGAATEATGGSAGRVGVSTGGTGGVVNTGGASTGGAGSGGGGHGGAGGASSCLPVNVVCGSKPSCPILLPDGGTASGVTPSTTRIVGFDPDDPRWAALYRACAASSPLATCGTECSGFCTAVLMANGAGLPGSTYAACAVTCGELNSVTIEYLVGVCGRRSGACVNRNRLLRSAPTLGDHLAAAAELEAESVPAFGRLGRDLAAHGAPADLVRAARVAMGEEARHWRRTRELAHRRGGRAIKPTIVATAPASLEELAIDNVIEGCVRETYGAMVAAHQATQARDPDVRRLMGDIAADERGHAALSWKIDEWAVARLGPAFRARRTEAVMRAVSQLLAASFQATDAEVAADAGLPDQEKSHALLVAAWTHIWQPSVTTATTATRA